MCVIQSMNLLKSQYMYKFTSSSPFSFFGINLLHKGRMKWFFISQVFFLQIFSHKELNSNNLISFDFMIFFFNFRDGDRHESRSLNGRRIDSWGT